jgi:hypothetical protein
MDRRELLQRLGAAGLLSAGGVAGFLQRALAAGVDPVPPGLHKVSGTVTVNGQPARPGQLIRPGDTVATGADGEAVFVIGQDAFLQRSGSTVSFGNTAAYSARASASCTSRPRRSASAAPPATSRRDSGRKPTSASATARRR